MKTKNTNSFKGVFAGIIAAIIILTTSCESPTQKDRNSEPSMDLQTAVISGNIDAVKAHIEQGTNLNEKEPMGGSSPLITAIVFGQKEAASLLINAGADLNIKNNDGSTALHCAAFFCHPDMVKSLLEKGADASIKNNYGSTARETVLGNWSDIKPIYEFQMAQLSPLGLKLDLERIERTRPEIAELLN